MTAVLVFLSCGYQIGCSETTQTYYLNDPSLQESAKYAESMAKNKIGERTFIIIGSLAGAAGGSDFTAPLTTFIQLKGNLKWRTAGLNYSYKF